MNKLKTTLVFGILLIAFLSAGCLEVSGDKSGETFPAGEPENIPKIPDEQKAASTGMPVPGLEGSGVVEKIAVDGSGAYVSSVDAVMARAEILPPIPPTGGVSYSGSGIHVSGYGKAVAVPDIAIFSAGVVTTDKTAAGASRLNAEAMDRVIKALKAMGIEDKDIKTQTVSVWPEYDYGYRDGYGRELPLIIGYRAENTVSVTLRDISMAGEAIDAVVKAGSNQVYGLSYSFSDEKRDALYASALKAAVADGTRKAGVIADAIGAEKITPVSVSESGGYYTPVYRVDFAEAAAKDGSMVPTPVSPGELEVSASVSMSFDFA